MASIAEKKTRLQYHKTAAERLRAAYIALADGGVQSYTIGSRSLTKYDLPTISDEIEKHENKADELAADLAGTKRRRAVGVVPRDW